MRLSRFSAEERQQRLQAFDYLCQLKNEGYSRQDTLQKIKERFNIPVGTLYLWHTGTSVPFGRKGTITSCPELYYVIGALLGDGCLYNWNITNHFTILVGAECFAKKYATKIFTCTGKLGKAYIDRTKGIWFVKVNNYALFSMFKQCREDANYLSHFIVTASREEKIHFIEGFFDAEGCVKIINDKSRKLPKICLDITNTNREYLDSIQNILETLLSIDSRYSIQPAHLGTDGYHRKTTYHLRVYRKAHIAKFFQHINTIKLTPVKQQYLQNWMNSYSA